MTVLCVRGRNAVRCLSMCTAPMAGCRRESVSACRCPVPDVDRESPCPRKHTADQIWHDHAEISTYMCMQTCKQSHPVGHS